MSERGIRTSLGRLRRGGKIGQSCLRRCRIMGGRPRSLMRVYVSFHVLFAVHLCAYRCCPCSLWYMRINDPNMRLISNVFIGMLSMLLRTPDEASCG